MWVLTGAAILVGTTVSAGAGPAGTGAGGAGVVAKGHLLERGIVEWSGCRSGCRSGCHLERVPFGAGAIWSGCHLERVPFGVGAIWSGCRTRCWPRCLLGLSVF